MRLPLATFVLIAVMALTACGGAVPVDLVPATPAGGESTAPPMGGGPGVVAPVFLDATTTTAEVAVGRFIVFNVDKPASWTMTADPADLVVLTPGSESADLVTNPGAETKAAGSVTVTLKNTAGDTLVFTITIK